ncbi:TonB-dependent siderophore receptor [Pedobacter sp. AW31-3R]|uniref:TonB-dependent siderophore receptor n=1 Tax=Pedobacter sp. AW31-3R TaxID=3445781 RepID=UPI003F9FAFF0
MKLFLPVLFLFSSFFLHVNAQHNGKITGEVITSDGKAADNLTIKLRGTATRSTSSDAIGKYEFSSLKAGSYILLISRVGLANQERKVVLGTGETLRINFTLHETRNELLEIQVNGSPLNKFARKETETVARLPIGNLENPQVYSIISQEMMKEQLVTDYKTAFKNVPGLVATTALNGGHYIKSRGFYSGSFLRNGMAAQQYAGIDPVNTERIEVLKGPSGTLFGSSLINFGGLANRITKKPFEVAAGEVSVTAGNFNMGRITADLNTPLNESKTVLFRLNAAAGTQDNFQDYGVNRSVVVAPSFVYKVNNRLTLLMDAEFYASGRVAPAYPLFGGQTARNFKDLPLDYHTSLTTDDAMIKQKVANVYTQAEYKINDQWKSVSQIAYSRTHWSDYSNVFSYWLDDHTINRLVSVFRPRDFESVNLQQNFTGEFKTAGLKHRLLIGLDAYFNKNSYTTFPTVSYDVVDINHTIAEFSLDKMNQLVNQDKKEVVKSSQNQYAVYVSDVINITDRWLTMLSLRADRLDNRGTKTNEAATLNKYAQTAWSPKLGLVYQPLKDRIALFANYMNGFQNIAPVIQPDGTTASFKAQQANQWEGGAKFDLFNHKLSATVSYYHIEVSNSLRTEQVMVNGIPRPYTFQDGSQKSKGYELEVIGNPVPGLNFILGYGHNENKIIKATANSGNYSGLSPKDMANAWVSYRLLQGKAKGLGLGAGANYAADSFWDATNKFVIPSYVMFDASVFYDLQKWTFTTKLNNLTSEKAWDINGVPFAPCQVMANIAFRF